MHSIALRLTRVGIPTPMGKSRWNVARVRGILKNPGATRAPYTRRVRQPYPYRACHPAQVGAPARGAGSQPPLAPARRVDQRAGA